MSGCGGAVTSEEETGIEPSRGWLLQKAKPDTGIIMAHSVAQLQAENVVYELECIDRMYLNCYVPKLSNAAGVAGFIRFHKGRRFASTVDVAEMGKAFVRSIFKFAKQHEVPIHRFAKGERKDEVTQRFLKDFDREEGVLYIGIAQEKASVPRTVRKRFGDGGSIPWITEGVIPSLHVYYKNTHLKQYHKTWKKGAALRTETTINNTYDFGVGSRLRLHGLIERIEKSHRYRVTKKGLAAVHFYHRLYTRLLRPALSVPKGEPGPHPTPEEKPLQQLHSAMDRFIQEQAA